MTTDTVHIEEFSQHQTAGSRPPLGYETWRDFAAAIPLYEIVDRGLLYQGDDDPFHVVLDIARVGAQSVNGLLYDEDLVSSIEQQLAGKGGVRGHVKESDSSNVFPHDAIDWVGHLRVGDTLYAKGYFPPGHDREEARRRLARGGQLRTSIAGRGIREIVGRNTYRVKNFTLESLDLAPPHKAALKDSQSGNIVMTRETIQENGQEDGFDMTNITLNDVPQSIQEQIIRNAQVQADAARVGELESSISEFETRISEFETRISEFEIAIQERETRITELEGERNTLQGRIAEFENVRFESTINSAIAEMTASWNTPNDEARQQVAQLQQRLRRDVIAELGNERNPDRITEVVQQVWDDNSFITEAVRSKIMGPSAQVGGQRNNAWQPSDPQESRSKMGF